MNTTTGQVLLLSPQRFPLDLIPLSNWNLDVGEGHYSHLHFLHVDFWGVFVPLPVRNHAFQSRSSTFNKTSAFK